VQIGKAPRDEAELYGELAMQSGYFRWCFDEMDGMELDLQQLAIFVSNHARADDFIREILLDCEVSDTLKLELLQLLYERNENNKFTAVICHIYRDLDILKVNIGRKRRKKFINAYAQTASKFAIEWDGKKIKKATEKIYQAFLEQDCWELSDDVGSLACAIYLLSDINEAGSTPSESSFLFSAKPEQVEKILARLNKTE
jgi:hypothetical protein